MLKSVLYVLLMATTSVRFIDIVYLLLKDRTNLPVAVLAVTSAMIVYGVFLLAKKFISKVTLKQLMYFYIIQTVMIAFNLFYIAIFCPLRISAAETFIAGTFLDILVNCAVIHLCTKQLRSRYFAIVDSAILNRHV